MGERETEKRKKSKKKKRTSTNSHTRTQTFARAPIKRVLVSNSFFLWRKLFESTFVGKDSKKREFRNKKTDSYGRSENGIIRRWRAVPEPTDHQKWAACGALCQPSQSQLSNVSNLRNARAV